MLLRASNRLTCRHSRRLRYRAPMRSAISSLIVASGKARRWDEVAAARLWRSDCAANVYNSIGYSGAKESRCP